MVARFWALVEQLSAADPHYEINAFLAHPEARRHFRHRGSAIGDLFEPGPTGTNVNDFRAILIR